MSKLFWLVKGQTTIGAQIHASGIGIVVLLALLVWGAVAGITALEIREP
ncbi:MAG: hypothetical protein ABIT34_05180 [Gammaproteobacteria bacterium]